MALFKIYFIYHKTTGLAKNLDKNYRWLWSRTSYHRPTGWIGTHRSGRRSVIRTLLTKPINHWFSKSISHQNCQRCSADRTTTSFALITVNSVLSLISCSKRLAAPWVDRRSIGSAIMSSRTRHATTICWRMMSRSTWCCRTRHTTTICWRMMSRSTWVTTRRRCHVRVCPRHIRARYTSLGCSIKAHRFSCWRHTSRRMMTC